MGFDCKLAEKNNFCNIFNLSIWRSKLSGFVYQGRKTNEISFPLGGIGTGCIGLAGNGRLIDWEIFNRPNKGGFNRLSHFAVKAEQHGKVLDARVLNGDLHPPYAGQLNRPEYEAFGFGPPRENMAGLPHFKKVRFTGPFPVADLLFQDDTFPGQVRLTGFNPFIPLNEKDSGIPAAFFEIEIRNTTASDIVYTLAGTVANPLPATNIHRVSLSPEGCFLNLNGTGIAAFDPKYGDVTLATDAKDVSYQEYWYRGGWNDNLEVFWRDFTSPGEFKNRSYSGEEAGRENHGTIATRVAVAPGKRAKVRFVIAWNFPNCINYWNKESAARAARQGLPNLWKNWYATQWDNSQESAAYCLQNWDRLFRETAKFRDVLKSSSLPEAAIDAITANLSILKSPTVYRLADGTLYGWEGCHPSSGCCEGSCTHVWNYAQTLPFLFPKLERSMREADYKCNLLPSGGMPFRIQLPLGTLHEPANAHRPCADGQFGGVMKVYRDWKICGDTEWVRRLWHAVKASIEFAWSPQNPDRWDPEKTGALQGRQHHTLDMELFGPNAWLTGFYLGALKAGAEMADALGEPETASEYRAIFARGKAWMDENLFNGEYYDQKLNLNDKALLERFDALSYWSEEHQEIKYQIGEGCGIDQVLAQWHANLYGLGEIYDPKQTKSALQALFKHNFKPSMRNFYNPWRVFCINDEGGIVIADWPEGKTKPMIPVCYAQETMNGFEYSAAILMIQNGMIDEGMTIVAALRDRYDGEKRNPWNEFECGSSYARSMASYALLNAFSGFEFDMRRGYIGFHPVGKESVPFRCLWSLDCAWGEVEITSGKVELRVFAGSIALKEFGTGIKPEIITLAGRRVSFSTSEGGIRFNEEATILAGEVLLLQSA